MNSLSCVNGMSSVDYAGASCGSNGSPIVAACRGVRFKIDFKSRSKAPGAKPGLRGLVELWSIVIGRRVSFDHVVGAGRDREAQRFGVFRLKCRST
jgi:hypothetical protein